ncbi:uncharacterized protein ACO6RY_03643 [Pungitius sinensis]
MPAGSWGLQGERHVNGHSLIGWCVEPLAGHYESQGAVWPIAELPSTQEELSIKSSETSFNPKRCIRAEALPLLDDHQGPSELSVHEVNYMIHVCTFKRHPKHSHLCKSDQIHDY